MAFFGQLEGLLAWTVQYRSRLMPKHIADLLEPAWEELQPSFDAVRKKLSDVEEVPDSVLKERGLTGNQLALKLRAFETQHRAFLDRYGKTVEQGGPLTRLLSRLLHGIRDKRSQTVGSGSSAP